MQILFPFSQLPENDQLKSPSVTWLWQRAKQKITPRCEIYSFTIPLAEFAAICIFLILYVLEKKSRKNLFILFFFLILTVALHFLSSALFNTFFILLLSEYQMFLHS